MKGYYMIFLRIRQARFKNECELIPIVEWVSKWNLAVPMRVPNDWIN